MLLWRVIVWCVDRMVTVSVSKSWSALKRCRSGFPNKNSHPPPLSKISNSPCARSPPNSKTPLHTACDGTMTPFAMRNRWLDSLVWPSSRCWILLKMDVHMEPTMAPPSNRALTLTISPQGPWTSSQCVNGTSLCVARIWDPSLLLYCILSIT